MGNKSSVLIIDSHADDDGAIAFCKKFLCGNYPRYIFGRNEYADSIAALIDVDGFVDDFTKDTDYLGKPIIKSENLPKNGLVVSVVVGRPFVAEARLAELGINFLDYFSFKRYAGINVAPVKFWDEFKKDFYEHRDRYEWIYGMLSDEESKRILGKIVNFRLSHDINYMRGFSDAQHRQYFEDFLELRLAGESFIDVGCFDGYTTLEFIKRCPDYSSISIFEPEPKNMAVVKQKLAGYPRIDFYPYGLSNASKTLKFTASGSCSRVSDEGELEIPVRRLDDIITKPFTFMKMDIEGGEPWAIEGAQQSIANYHPRLAISVYHRFDDLWRIPEQVLKYRDDYQLFLRHYTEGVDETVMFFIPNKPR